MKQRSFVLFALAAAIAALPFLASAAGVTSKPTCLQAVADARDALAAAAISEKARTEAADMVRISEHLCGEANFVYAETLLAIARGMAAEE